MTINVPLSSLRFGGDIDSRSGPNRGVDIDSLRNSIARLGLILPLSVKADGDSYIVIDGNRRLAALKIIHEGNGHVGIPVLVQAADIATAREMSLAANIERVPLHPMDQYEAFAAIVAEGKTVADVAAAFGIGERQVEQRLALGTLIEPIREAFRKDELRAGDMRSIANLSPARQQELWDSGLRGWQLAQAATPDREGTLAWNSTLAEYVGRDAYVAAGGTFVTDLFVNEDKQMWADPALAEKIAKDMLGKDASEYIALGWQFCEQPEGYVGSEYTFEDPAGDVDPARITEPEDRARWDELLPLLVADKPMLSGEEIDTETIETMMQDIESEYDCRPYTPEQRARLGVVIDKFFEVHLGAAKRADFKSADKTGEDDGKPVEKIEPDFADSMRLELNGHLTHAVQGCIMDDPVLAKKVLLAHLISQEAMQYGGVLTMRLDPFKDHAHVAYKYGRETVVDPFLKAIGYGKAKTLPARLKALDKLDDNDLNIVLAYFISQSVALASKDNALVAHLHSTKALKPLDHWTPTVENFFGRLSKKQLARIAKEEKIAIDVGPLKCGEAAAKIRAALPDTWVPAMMRG